jgi:hypothetical protein
MTLEIPTVKTPPKKKELSVVDCSMKSIDETSSSEGQSSYYQEENVLGLQLRRLVIGEEKQFRKKNKIEV